MARSRAVVVAAGAALLLGIATLARAGGVTVAGGPAVPDDGLPLAGRVTARVVEVIDGDTVVVERAGRRARVRLLGIDTPETVHPTRPVECFGPEATAAASALLAGRVVELEFDVERHDRYGRWLAHVHVGGRHVNEQLVREGFAELQVFPPNERHARRLLAAELEARAERRGLWGACR